MEMPTNLTPLGPEMAFEMPQGECLPMWVRDSTSESWRIALVTAFDGKKARSSFGDWWNQCAPLEGHPIPESALVNKPDRLMTWREVAELLNRFNWGELYFDGSYTTTLVYEDGDKPFAGDIRKWGSDELVRPMYSLLLDARKEAGV